MRKKDILNKKKFVSNTYMREAVDYDIVTIKEDDLFVTIKKYKKMNGTFTLKFEDGINIDYINEGYYVVELTPLKENYNIRYYLQTNQLVFDIMKTMNDNFNGLNDRIEKKLNDINAINSTIIYPQNYITNDNKSQLLI